MNGRGLLLDTCTLMWRYNGDPMSEESKKAIAEATIASEIYVSPISAWEIGMLTAKGRITLSMPPASWFEEVLAHPGVQMVDMTPRLLVESSYLPGKAPRNPMDRVFVSTARSFGLTLVTRDRQILDYAKQGNVWALKC